MTEHHVAGKVLGAQETLARLLCHHNWSKQSKGSMMAVLSLYEDTSLQNRQYTDMTCVLKCFEAVQDLPF